MDSIQYIWKDRKRIFGMPLSFTRYRLSEDRLFCETGFLNIKQDEVLLYRVRDLQLNLKLTQRIFDEGHEIGYPGFSHTNLRDMSRRAIGGELIDSRALLPQGCEPVFLRPPGGIVTDGVRQVAEARQLAILSWSVDPKDWATDSVGSIESAVLKSVKDGDIILLHDMSVSSVQAALDIVDVL